MKTEIKLQEYVSSRYSLTGSQLEALIRKSRSLDLSIEHGLGYDGMYSLRPSAIVGALEIDGLSVSIEPKIGIPQLLSLACYTLSKLSLRREQFDFREAETLPDILAFALNRASRRAFSRGLLHGYLSEEDALHTVRGRILFGKHVQRRFSIPLPVELRFDEFTEDILANRMVKAAAVRLGRMTRLSSEARRELGWITSVLENVSLRDYRRLRVPEIHFDRLNEHYRHVVGLARLILMHSEFESARGDVRASGFLVNMNDLFQEFVTQALRETLGVSDRILRDDKGIDKISLDRDGRVPIEPDLSWWDGDKPTFVGDAKYKDLTDRRARNADLFQLLAYATALNLPGGLLIYAQGGAGTKTYQVRHIDRRLLVAALDLSEPLDEILQRVKKIGRSIEELRDEARRKRLEMAA